MTSHRYSVERLLHLQCWSCSGWWTIGDGDGGPGSSHHCPRCGTHSTCAPAQPLVTSPGFPGDGASPGPYVTASIKVFYYDPTDRRHWSKHFKRRGQPEWGQARFYHHLTSCSIFLPVSWKGHKLNPLPTRS